MRMTGEREKAVNYETILSLCGDRAKAYRLLMALPDAEAPLEGEALAALSSVLGRTEAEIASLRVDIESAFLSERLSARSIFPEFPLFPEEKGETFPCIYAAGSLDLLAMRRVTLVGMPSPSMQGRDDMAEAVSYFAEHSVAMVIPLSEGLPSMAASLALDKGGCVIGVPSSSVSKCVSHEMAELQGRIYASGLLISPFPPSQKTERWLVMIRNRFIASISEAVFLAEEKDGGPSWPIFDSVLVEGGRAMFPSSMLTVPSYTWAASRYSAGGALTYSSVRDLRRLVPSRQKSIAPDLFS